MVTREGGGTIAQCCSVGSLWLRFSGPVITVIRAVTPGTAAALWSVVFTLHNNHNIIISRDQGHGTQYQD